MDILKAESEFFHDISKAVIDLVQNSSKDISIVEDKGIGDYSTQIDVSVEELIVFQLGKCFPEDRVLAEEGYSNTEIPDSRIWFIDPICGTNNLGKGINNFCTNIALVHEKRVVASCVIDHSQGEYFWSTGNSEVYVGNEPYQAPSNSLGRKVDVDFGSVRSVSDTLRRKHNKLLFKLIEETDFDIISLNASLGFAYTAIGKTDGFLNIFNHPWDIAAASFLIQQAGGVITGVDGSSWSITTIGAIGGHTSEIHKELLTLFLNS